MWKIRLHTPRCLFTPLFETTIQMLFFLAVQHLCSGVKGFYSQLGQVVSLGDEHWYDSSRLLAATLSQHMISAPGVSRQSPAQVCCAGPVQLNFGVPMRTGVSNMTWQLVLIVQKSLNSFSQLLVYRSLWVPIFCSGQEAGSETFFWNPAVTLKCKIHPCSYLRLYYF